MTKRYYGYTRVSTTRQGEGVSLQEQRAAIEAYAKKCGLDIVQWFEERETAAKEGRTAFTRMLKLLAARRADGVIIHKIDRSARNLFDWSSIGKLADQGIDIRFAHDGMDLNSRGSRLSADIMAVVAADFVRNLRDEVRKGVEGRFKQGLFPLPAPLGYLDMGPGKPKEIDPIKGPLVAWLFERYASGEVSLHTLAEEAAARGLTAKFGGVLKFNPLSKLLKNPFYIGLTKRKSTGEVYQGVHTPLVSQSTFKRVQDVLEGRLRRKELSHEFYYRQFLRCGHCGRVASGERRKGRYVYYRCYNNKCVRPACREADVFNAVYEALSECTLRPQDLSDLRDLLESTTDRRRELGVMGLQEISLQLKRCDERIDRIADAMLDGLLERDEYERRKLRLLTEKRRLLDIREDIASTNPAVDEVREILKLQNVLQVRHSKTDMEDAAQLARLVSQNCTLYEKTPVITLRNPYLEIQKWKFEKYVHHHGARTKLGVQDLLDRLMKAVTDELLQPPSSPNVLRRGTHGLDAAA